MEFFWVCVMREGYGDGEGGGQTSLFAQPLDVSVFQFEAPNFVWQ